MFASEHKAEPWRSDNFFQVKRQKEMGEAQNHQATAAAASKAKRIDAK